MVNENWEKRKFMSLSLNKEAVSAIMDSTEFLNGIYSKISLRTRAYVLKHGITLDTLPRCKCNCGRYAAINNSRAEQGFRVYCGPLCSRSDKTIDKSLIALFDNYDFLYDEKIVKQKSIEQIAEEHGISTIPVVKYLKKHKLYQLNDARSVDSKKIEMLTNHDQMYDYYITKNLTLKEIASIIGCSSGVIIKHLNRHDIKIKKSNSYERKIKRTSKEEIDLLNYIQSITSSKIQQGNRKILNGKEIDIYIPSRKIAIEYNGIYSHLYRENETTESRIKGIDYHLSKTITARNQGVNLYHIFSSDWNDKPNKIKNFLKRILHLNSVVEVKDDFTIHREVNNSKILLKLISNNTLLLRVKLVKHDNYLVLTKYQVKNNVTLKNGFSKIIIYLKLNYDIPIYYRVDRRYSEGCLFTSYGFKVVKVQEPTFLYTDNSYDSLYEKMIPNKVNHVLYNCGYLILKYS